MRRAHSLASLVLCFGASGFGQSPVIDWDKQKAEILDHYRTLIQTRHEQPSGQ